MGSLVWPEVVVRARDQREVDCLLAAFAQAGVVCRAEPGFRVEVGGAQPEQILRAAQQCLTDNAIDSVEVTLRSGEYVLSREV